MAQMMRIGYDFLRLGFHPSVAGLGASESFTWREALTGKLRAWYKSALKGKGGKNRPAAATLRAGATYPEGLYVCSN
jgi:hypothetical protein